MKPWQNMCAECWKCKNLARSLLITAIICAHVRLRPESKTPLIFPVLCGPTFDRSFVKAVVRFVGWLCLEILRIFRSLMMPFVNFSHIKKICFVGLRWLKSELHFKVCQQEFVGLSTASAPKPASC